MSSTTTCARPATSSATAPWASPSCAPGCYTLGRRGTSALLAWRVGIVVLAILSTAIVASCDEFHQTFIPSRTGTPVDVLLDTAGATTLLPPGLADLLDADEASPEQAW